MADEKENAANNNNADNRIRGNRLGSFTIDLMFFGGGEGQAGEFRKAISSNHYCD